MTKELLELSTREFVYVLLGYQPKEKITIIGGDKDNSSDQIFEGTYLEIVDALSSNQFLRDWFEETTFDYQKVLDYTDTVTYLRHRTDHFDSDLAQALLIDIDKIEKQVFAQVEAGFQDKNEFERWKESHTSSYYKAKSFLQSKCEEFRKIEQISFPSVADASTDGGVNHIDDSSTGKVTSKTNSLGTTIPSNPQEPVVFRQLEGSLASAQPYFEALYPKYMDENLKWKKKARVVTNYHAYWVARILLERFPDIQMQTVGDFLGIDNLRHYSTEARLRENIKKTILAIFRGKNLDAPDPDGD